MKSLHYTLLDVFTAKRFGGNQLAVFHGEENLSAETMQQIARELNLSETVFICPPKDSTHEKSLRIFTPTVELPIAGHPTVGAAFVMADRQLIKTQEGKNEWVLEELIGAVPVTVFVEGGKAAKVEMTQPIPEFGEKFPKAGLVADLLSLTSKDLDNRFPAQTVSSGLPFLFIPVRSLDAMRKINFRMDIWERHFSKHADTQNIFVFTTETQERQSTVHSRMFAPAMGIAEDPATGAAGGPLGAYLVAYGVVPHNSSGIYRIRSEQGAEMKRPSFIDITVTESAGQFKQVKIGGISVLMGQGEIFLPD